MPPNRYTIDDILALEPCWGFTENDIFDDSLARHRIIKIWPRGQGTSSVRDVTARDIADEHDVDFEDSAWVLVQLLPTAQLRLLLCWFAERFIAVKPDKERDSKVMAIIAVVRRYVDGHATDDEMRTTWNHLHDVVGLTPRTFNVLTMAINSRIHRIGIVERVLGILWDMGCNDDPHALESIYLDKLVRLHELTSPSII